jgi:hypothetical protein
MSETAPRRVWRWLLLALLPCLAYLASELYLLDGGLGLPLDDSFIHLQFARNLAAGEGLSYNPGERVTGSTSPLWTALLSVGFLLPVEPLAWAKLLGVCCHLLAVAATWRLARTLELPPPLAAFATGVMAATNWLVWSSLSAMEVSLFCAVSLLGIARHVEERRTPALPPLALPLLALSVLLRPEGILLLVLAVIDRLLLPYRTENALRLAAPPWRALLQGLLLAAVALLPVLLVYQAIGGSPLPTTFSTKGGYATPGLPRPGFLLDVLSILLQAQPLTAVLVPAGIVVLSTRVGEERGPGLLPALWVLALPLAYGVLGGAGKSIVGNFGRYFFPLLPVTAVLAAAALLPLLAVPGRLSAGRLSLAWRRWAVLLLLLPGAVALLKGGALYAQSVVNMEEGDVRMAHLLRGLLPAQATLAVNDIGAIKYLLPNRIVDLAGIATPEVHAYARRSAASTGSYCPGLLEYVRHARPDYLAIFPNWHRCFSPREFPPLLRVQVADNITLGDDEIVLHATPWTRHPLRRPPTARAGAPPAPPSPTAAPTGGA